MMYPIALAIGALFGDSSAARNLRTALMLGIAYAASIGGMGTLIGTPPNLIFAGTARQLAGYDVGFLQFMAVGVPVVALLLPICWALLMLLFPGAVEFSSEARALLREKREALGKLRGGERIALSVFLLTAVAWFFREPKQLGGIRVPGLTDVAPGITDTTVGVTGALVLFAFSGVTREGERRPILTWREARGIPWEVLLIFGGGFSLATAIETSGLAKWLGSLTVFLTGYPTIVIYGGIALIVLVLTELASNTAVATMAMPIVASLASAMGQPRLALMLLAALVASCGFALPTATAPNIIVFGSGHITVRQMARAGLALDLIATALIVLAVTALYPMVFG
jgi:sodium-dependent dicarboxylate transporter 2/3/5